jgi:MFS family permease
MRSSAGQTAFSRPCQLWLLGQTASGIGTWMTRLAIAWYVFRVTHSVALLGLIGFAGQIPVLLLSPIAAWVVDSCSRKHLFVATQVNAALQAFVLAYLYHRHGLTIPILAWLGILRGCNNAIDLPVRPALICSMAVSRALSLQLLSWDSLVVNLCRLIGPATAGYVLAHYGEGACFLIDALSYAASIGSVLLIPYRLHSREIARERGSWKSCLKQKDTAESLIVLCLISLLALPYTVVLPMHVSTVLRMGPEILGALTCASAISAIFCAGTFSVVSQILSIAQRSVTSIAGAAAGLVILAWTNTLWGAVFAVAVLSYSVMLQVCGTNAQLQEDVANEARGSSCPRNTGPVLGNTQRTFNKCDRMFFWNRRGPLLEKSDWAEERPIVCERKSVFVEILCWRERKVTGERWRCQNLRLQFEFINRRASCLSFIRGRVVTQTCKRCG